MRATRRELIGAGGLLLLTACTDPPTPAPTDPDVALREAAVARERRLLQAYDAVLLALPALAERLLPVRAEHLTHLTALTGTSPAGSSPAGSSPVTAALALAGLVEAERLASAGHAGDVAAASRPLAAVLAALSASEACHPLVLV